MFQCETDTTFRWPYSFLAVIVSVCSFILLSASCTVFAWGQTGHRITANIAERNLSQSAKQAIAGLIPNESLAEMSTYADEMRSNPGYFWQTTASPWHYVTVPEGKAYQSAPAQGDAVTALVLFRRILQDDQAAEVDKRRALRFIIHIVADLHQPLHVGNGRDRGGNKRPVKFMGSGSNLHRVWDSDVIESKKLSFSEWSSWLGPKITVAEAAQWRQTNPLVWIAESQKIRGLIYAELAASKTSSLSWDYIYFSMPIIKKRLQQAGIRISSYLNELYADQ
ncbi:MAG: S1/P1 nuclease [Pseudomonadales bacterium]|nr:S1/P1 nuclease [Pseudomonadales bacterium]